MTWFRNTRRDFESQKGHLEHLSEEALARYRKKLTTKISHPTRLTEAQGISLTSAELKQTGSRMCEMAAKMLNAPRAMVSIVTPDGQTSLSTWGSEPAPCNLADSFCQHVIGTGREFAVENAGTHPLVRDTSFARQGTIASYLGVPIIKNGWVVGVLCVFDSANRELGVVDVSILASLAAVMSRALMEQARQ